MRKLYFDAICENLLFTQYSYDMYEKANIHTYVDTYGHRQYASWGLSSKDIIIMNALCNQHPDNKCTCIQILQLQIFWNIARVNTYSWYQGSRVPYIVAAAMHCVNLSPDIRQTNISVHSLTDGDLPGFWIQVHESGTQTHTAQYDIS